jgi:hypothetical protein
MSISDRIYFHLHDLPDGRIQAIYYDGPKVKNISRREIVRREGEDLPSPEDVGPIEYRCDCCRNWGTGTEMEVEWARPLG